MGGSYQAQAELRILDDRFGDSTSGNPDSWMVFVENPTESPLGITVFVACVTPSSVSPF
jgi:hypothetical protein